MSKLQASTKVAGSYYYEAEALHKAKKLTKGTGVVLRRDPTNEYDKNAIQVLHASGAQIGFIPKRFAATLALLMDSGTKASAAIKEAGNRDGRLYISLSLSYTNLPRVNPTHKPSPRTKPVRPQPSRRHGSPLPAKPRSPATPHPKSQFSEAKSHQTENEAAARDAERHRIAEKKRKKEESERNKNQKIDEFIEGLRSHLREMVTNKIEMLKLSVGVHWSLGLITVILVLPTPIGIMSILFDPNDPTLVLPQKSGPPL